IGDHRVSFAQTDLLKSATKTLTFDQANWGRKVSERFTDAIPGGPAIESETSFQYRDDFSHGLIPVATTTRNPVAGIEFFHTQTKSFDPQARRISAIQ